MLYTRQASGKVSEVVERLDKAIKDNHFGILGVIDLKAKLIEKGVPFEQLSDLPQRFKRLQSPAQDLIELPAGQFFVPHAGAQELGFTTGHSLCSVVTRDRIGLDGRPLNGRGLGEQICVPPIKARSIHRPDQRQVRRVRNRLGQVDAREMIRRAVAADVDGDHHAARHGNPGGSRDGDHDAARHESPRDFRRRMRLSGN